MKQHIIYAAECPDGKKYIGTTTMELEKRIGFHKRAARNIKTKSKWLNAILKYGIDNINFFIIDTASNIESAYNLEILYIKHFNSFNNGYNSNLGGTGKGQIIHQYLRDNTSIRSKEYQKNKIYTIEERSLISKRILEAIKKDPTIKKRNSDAKKEYYKNPDNVLKNVLAMGGREFLVFDLHNNFKGKYINISDFCRKNNFNSKNAIACLNGRRNATGNHKFIYIDSISYLISDEIKNSIIKNNIDFIN